MTFWLLFYEFFKTGLFAVGGGMATIPFLYAISEKTGWFTAADIGNMIAISGGGKSGGIDYHFWAGTAFYSCDYCD